MQETKTKVDTFSFDKGRLVSLDVLRGLTIAGMIIVNDPGSWSHLYAPLAHADWHGITPTDLVFPFFLYIVGVSIALSYTKQMSEGMLPSQMHGKILKRTLIIFLLGIFLWLFPKFDFAGVRIPGVLQRIALVFMACAFMFIHTSWKTQVKWGIGLLVGYWLAMTFIPVPIDEVIQQALATGQVKAQAGMTDIGTISALSDNFISANLEKGTNLEAWLDRTLIPGRLWQYTWDPEGLLSTLPSIATGICGMLAGHLLLSKLSVDKKLIWLFAAGFLSFLLGCAWDWIFPINKNLWTSSYVLYTSGLATLSLAVSILFIDVLKMQSWAKFAIIFGANAIAAYVLHGILARLIGLFTFGAKGQTIQALLFNGMVDIGMAPKMASFAYALLYTFICFLPIWWMYRKKIFLKV